MKAEVRYVVVVMPDGAIGGQLRVPFLDFEAMFLHPSRLMKPLAGLGLPGAGPGRGPTNRYGGSPLRRPVPLMHSDCLVEASTACVNRLHVQVRLAEGRTKGQTQPTSVNSMPDEGYEIRCNNCRKRSPTTPLTWAAEHAAVPNRA